MKHPAWRMSVVVAVVLLTSVGRATAECAWVLWMGDSTHGWRVENAYESKALCHAGLSVLQAVNAGQGWESGCLPDTVDPRVRPADCRWALWTWWGEVDGWEVERGHASKGFCEARLHQVSGASTRPGNFVCLPDTVDPRGLKAR
jgi:hypothetical protein